MLRALRERHPGVAVWRILYWAFMHFLCYVWVAPCYRYRAWGITNVPRTGPVLLVSSHQSFMDPILVGLGCHHRQFYAMARATLWDSALLGKLIDSLNAIPVDQESADLPAMRKCVDVLRKNQGLLVFPEGARTEDGSIAPFAPGMMLLVRRAKPKVVPVAIEGAFDVWSRYRKAPKLCGRVGVVYGEPIEAERLLAMEAPTEFLRQQCEVLRQEAARRIGNPREMMEDFTAETRRTLSGDNSN